tara:strand:+ start:318 stop:485 length:168 start_codon:yes stop_codon:yes gene_type:complete
MNDFLDNLANRQYDKMIKRIEIGDIEVEDDPKVKLKDMDSDFEVDIDFTIDLTEE